MIINSVVVGSGGGETSEPTIYYRDTASTVIQKIDNVLTEKISTSYYCYQFKDTSGTAIRFNLASLTTLVLVVKLRVTQSSSSTRAIFGSRPLVYTGSSGSISVDSNTSDGGYLNLGSLPANYDINEWIYYVLSIDNKKCKMFLLDNNYNIMATSNEVTASSFYSENAYAYIGGNGYNTSYQPNGIEFIPSESFIVKDGTTISGVYNANIINAIS